MYSILNLSYYLFKSNKNKYSNISSYDLLIKPCNFVLKSLCDNNTPTIKNVEYYLMSFWNPTRQYLRETFGLRFGILRLNSCIVYSLKSSETMFSKLVIRIVSLSNKTNVPCYNVTLEYSYYA